MASPAQACSQAAASPGTLWAPATGWTGRGAGEHVRCGMPTRVIAGGGGGRSHTRSHRALSARGGTGRVRAHGGVGAAAQPPALPRWEPTPDLAHILS